MPVLESHWIMKSGFSGEKDARAWTVRNCPSWRCDRDGRCRPGVAAKRERPLNFLPILPEEGFPVQRTVDNGLYERYGGFKGS